MKMPRRPWYPPVKPRPDIFGLHHVTLAGAGCESDVERQQRFAKVKAGVIAAFKAAVHHMGEDAACELFKSVQRRPKRGPGKVHPADRDARLLKAYDAAAPKGESIASIARRLHATEGKELGNTAAAVAAQIRKLVAARKKREYRARVEARRLRMAMRNEPPTLAAGGTPSEWLREK
jgi:hypothetical protein